MKKSIIPLIVTLLIISSFWGCKKIKKHRIKQGVITYTITYDTPKSQNPVVILLPKQMVLYFDNNKTSSQIQGYFGTFWVRFITLPDSNKKYTLVRILDNKYLYQTTLNGKNISSDEMKNLKVWLTDSTLTYKGLHCKVAKAYCPSVSKDTFDIIYTTDIAIKNPNAATPYAKIPGLILKSKLKLFNVVMNIDFKSLRKTQVPPEMFEIPNNGYWKPVSREKLEKLIKKLIK